MQEYFIIIVCYNLNIAESGSIFVTLKILRLRLPEEFFFKDN